MTAAQDRRSFPTVSPDAIAYFTLALMVIGFLLVGAYGIPAGAIAAFAIGSVIEARRSTAPARRRYRR